MFFEDELVTETSDCLFQGQEYWNDNDRVIQFGNVSREEFYLQTSFRRASESRTCQVFLRNDS